MFIVLSCRVWTLTYETKVYYAKGYIEYALILQNIELKPYIEIDENKYIKIYHLYADLCSKIFIDSSCSYLMLSLHKMTSLITSLTRGLNNNLQCAFVCKVMICPQGF